MLASLLQSEAYKQAVQTQLIADIAGAYYTLLYDAQLSIVQTSVGKYAKDVETMKLLKNSDVVTGAAVVQSTANYFAILATIPDIKNNIRANRKNTLSLLLARFLPVPLSVIAFLTSRYTLQCKPVCPAFGKPA